MPSTRRSVLRAATGLSSLTVAGCQSFSGDSEPTEKPQIDPVTDYTVVTLRRADGAPYRYTGNRRSGESLVVGSSDDIDALSFPTDGSKADEFGSFVRETDFEERSVLLYRRRVSECDRQHVESVWRRPGSLSVTLCRERRAADVDCSTDTEVEVGIAIRVPFTSDQFDQPTASTSSECTDRFGPRDTTTEGA
ncbi:hypothetical protein ACAH01_06955 [Halomicrobium sp. HM KBTZ05]|uniref:hypothetical protein n=1 Tax=Halomicrobium sp. HM KBTZ05 TaxID=3242663 RepID=UPI00355818EE